MERFEGRITIEKLVEEKRGTGETLISAFEKSSSEKVIDEKSLYAIKGYDLVWYFLHGTRGAQRYEEDEMKYRDSAREIFNIMQKGPESADALRLRQDFLSELVDYTKKDGGGKEKAVSIIDDLAAKGALCREIMGMEFRHSLERDALEETLQGINYFTDGRAMQALKEMEGVLAGIAGSSLFLAEIKEASKNILPKAEEYIQMLEKDQVKRDFEGLVEFAQSGYNDQSILSRIGIKDEQSFHVTIRKLSEKSQDVWDYIKVLRNFHLMLVFADGIIQRDMKKVEITDETRLEFRNAKHPFLLEHWRHNPERVVPFDISVDGERPNVVVTGDNATGKTKLVEAILYNSLLVQMTGYGFAEGGRYSLRKEISNLKALPSEVDEMQYSRGQKEMHALASIAKNIKGNGLITMDEVLTSTDSLGAISIVLASLEYNAEKGGISFLTIHSRDLEKIRSQNIIPSIQFLRAKESESGEKTYQWEEGVGRANPLKLAEEAELPKEIIDRAKIIQAQLENVPS